MLTLLPRRRMASSVPSTSSATALHFVLVPAPFASICLDRNRGVCCAAIAVIRSVVPLDSTADLVLRGLPDGPARV